MKITSSKITRALTILELLETITKKTEREKVLSKNKSNPALQAIIRMALGNEKFYVHVDPDLSLCTSELSRKKAWTRFVKLTTKLNQKILRGSKAKVKVLDLFIKCDPLMAKWLHRIMNHDLRCGIGKKTVSNVFGDQWLFSSLSNANGDRSPYAHSFRFRQCSAARRKDKLPKKYQQLPFPIAGEVKLDGERCLSFTWPSDGEVQFVSRKNLHKPELEQLEGLTNQFVKTSKRIGENDTPIFLDGEFLNEDWNSTSSVVSRTKNFNGDQFLKDTSVILFDWAPVERYETGSFDMSWQKRKHHLLGSLCRNLDPQHIGPGLYKTKCKNIFVLGHSILHDEQEVEEFYDLALQFGFEGIMLKRLDGSAIYDEKRGPEMVKIKPEKELTGTIVDCVAAEDGKNGPASTNLVKKARRYLSKYGTIKDDGYYLMVPVSKGSGSSLVKELKTKVQDGVDDRVWFNKKKGLLTYRYGARLKYFVVECDGQTFHVGGGIGYKNGKDLRMKFWRKRKRLKGMKIDFKHQDDPNPVAVMRFNSFKRLREDLSDKTL